jgi:RNA recognition motif-containing protein
LLIPPTIRDSRKLFVGGLPCDITSEEFHNFFEKFGQLIDSVVMFDHETNRSRGFGFVSFKDSQVANMLLAKGNENKQDAPGATFTGHLEMRGKVIEIKAAEPKPSGQKKKRSNGKRETNDLTYVPYAYDPTAYDPYFAVPSVPYSPPYTAQPFIDYVPFSPMHIPHQVGIMYPTYLYATHPLYYTEDVDAASYYGSSSIPPVMQQVDTGSLDRNETH